MPALVDKFEGGPHPGLRSGMVPIVSITIYDDAGGSRLVPTHC
jgi:hypothetical protein